MRIALTVESDLGSDDVLLDCDDAITVGELEHALTARLGSRVRVSGADEDLVARTYAHGAQIGRKRHRVRQGALQLHVVSGPDSGVVLELHPGEHVLGRGGDLSWADPSMSRRHLVMRMVDLDIEVLDLDSRHGTVLRGQACPPGVWVTWGPGEVLEVGNSIVVLREPNTAQAQSQPADPGWRTLLRPPRLLSARESPFVAFPEPPPAPEHRALPVVAMTVPFVIGAGIAALMRRPEYLFFALASPLMVAATYLGGRWTNSRRYASAVAAHERAFAEAEGTLAAVLTEEEHRLREADPDAAVTLMTALLPGRRLWERRRDDRDFLRLRVGTVDCLSSVVVKGVVAEPIVRRVPHVVDLAVAGTIGIVGPIGATDGILRWLLAQLVVYRAPRDVSVVVLAHDADESWSWLRWLPHLVSAGREPCSVAVGNDLESLTARASELIDLIRMRSASLAEHRASPLFPAVVVVIRGYRGVSSAIDVGGLVRDGPAVGVYVISTGLTDLELPEYTRSLVDASSGAYGSVIADDGRAVEQVLMEQVSTRWMDQCSRALAPLRDVVHEGPRSLPEQVRLLDLLGIDAADPVSLRQRWRARGSGAAAVLGMSAQGPLVLDLAVDGPHVLLAGMTGSGKTELLRSLVASMAIAAPPDRLALLLIDYKGDSAFGECARLPHVVGKVNDLDAPLVERALTSLRAELELRKSLFAQAGVTDIGEYQALVDPSARSLPRLVIVLDEFAELARELPEFVDGLVSVAQLGRSLGVHLVLATQRPSGVVSAAIRANTNIRIALRVVDAAESSDVVGVAAAADIPSRLPGRALLRMGERQVTSFQAAAVSTGAQRDAQRMTPLVTSWDWPSLGHEPPVRPAVEECLGPSDLKVIVEGVCAAADGMPRQRQPWVDPLPPVLLWSADGIDTARDLPELPFGVSDYPDQQRQQPATFDLPRDGHLFFVGAARSGRSQALRAVAASIAELTSPSDVHLYGLDCGSGVLNVLSALPHCGAVITRTEGERAGRLLRRLLGELGARQARLGEEGALDINEQRIHSNEPIPHIVFMLDGWEGFLSTLGQVPDHLDAVMRLLREGASAGIHLILTGDRALIMNARLSAMVDRKYLLRMADPTDYVLAGLRNRRALAEVGPGRCYGSEGAETQIYLLDQDPSGRAQAEVLRHLGEAASRRSRDARGVRPFRLDALPTRLRFDDVMDLLDPDASLPAPIVGVGGDELVAFAPDLGRASSFPVIGPTRSGRSSVLLGAALSALATGANVIAVAPRGGPLCALRGRPGVIAVLGSEASATGLEGAAAGSASVIVVDDADHLSDSTVGQCLLRIASGAVPGVFMLVGGTAEAFGGGFNNWQSYVRKVHQGLLLSPRALSDGDLIGVRLSRSDVGGAVRPGFGLLHLGGGEPIPVATVLRHSESNGSSRRRDGSSSRRC